MILDWSISHPLMQYIRDLSLVFVAKANLVEPPAGATSLIESNQGPLAFTVPREGFTDAVVLFPLLDGTTPNTTWFRFISFPLFLLNSMQALGNVREGSGEEVRSPGRPVILRAETLGKDLLVTSASGHATERLARTPQGSFVYNQAATTGLYHARWEPSGLLPFAVNLFDFRESDLAPPASFPMVCPRARPKPTRSRSATTPSPAPSKPRSSNRIGGNGSPARHSGYCSWSGTSTTRESIFECL